jgi:hypothetical protein
MNNRKLQAFCVFFAVIAISFLLFWSHRTKVIYQTEPVKTVTTKPVLPIRLRQLPPYELTFAEGFIGTDSRYLKPQGIWIDWTEDFNDWHYHGRNRLPTPVERSIHDLEIMLSKTTDQEKANSLMAQINSIEAKNAAELDRLAQDDKVRMAGYINEMVTVKNQKPGTQPFEEPKPLSSEKNEK